MTHHLTTFADVHAALCNPDLRQSLYDAGEIIMKDVLLTLHGAAHKSRRHLELRLFRRNTARNYERDVFPAILDGVLDRLVSAGEGDLVDFGYQVTMNLTADFAGLDRPGNSPEETEMLLRIVRSFSECATLVHSERNHVDVIDEVREALHQFRQFLDPSRERRLRLLQDFEAGKIREDELPRDVLTVLLRNQDNISLPDDVIDREIAFYLQAGSHSTANAMVHAIHELFAWTDRPAVLLKDPLLLQRCVHESLRLHPASPVAWRTPVCDTVLPGGVTAREGEAIILDLQAANRDWTVFGADADCFNPHRHINHQKAAAYGLTFGTGVHMCTGRDLDGGVVADAHSHAGSHQYGIVSRLVMALLENGARPHPDKPPIADERTSRANWRAYPVMFDSAPA